MSLPSPVQPLPLGPDLWIKRDDTIGGSKARMLGRWIPRLAGAGRTVVAAGPCGSNWLTLLVDASRRHGFPLELWTFPQAMNDRARRNREVLRSLGRAHHECRSPEDFALRAAAAAPRLLSRRVLVTPVAGTEPATIAAYVEAIVELAGQVKAGLLPMPQRIFVALGSGGIAAGLLAGITRLGLPTRIHAVRVTNVLLANRWRVLGLAAAALRLLGRPETPDPAQLIIETRFCGRYGAPIPAGRYARRRFAAEAGIELDDGYTAKTAAAMLASPAPGPTLLWHSVPGPAPG